MKIVFWSIGKPHEAYTKGGVEEFTKRVNNYFKAGWEIIPPVKNAAKMPVEEVKRAEAVLVLQKLQKDDFFIVLDERGKQLSSEELAGQLQHCANISAKRVVFLIGGAFGIADTLLEKAHFKWSLSKLVFPHQLVRLILAEQVYRACTILKNEKYHHQ